jgi:tripartite-type tricarboxylate transporter receptor subunit TctC
MQRFLRSIAAGALALAAISVGSSGGLAQGFYEGKVVTLIVPHSASGGYAQYAQLLAPKIAEQLKAREMRIEHHTGAGGILGINLVWHANPDGMTIGLSSGSSIMLASLAGGEGVQFDATKFVYLGRVASDDRIIFVGNDSEIKSIEDVTKLGRAFKVPSQGVDDDFYAMALLAKAIGFEPQFITGYEGGSDTTLAVIKGDGDGRLTSWTSAMAPLGAGDVRPILTIGEARHPDYPDVPTAVEAADASQKDTVRALMNIQALHRTFFGPPGMDPAGVAEMRAAIMAVVSDPAVQETAAKNELSLKAMDGADQEKLVAELEGASAAIPPILKEAEATLK